MKSSSAPVIALPQPEPFQPETFWSEVVEVTADGLLSIRSSNGPQRAVLATHVPAVLPGQRILAIQGAGNTPALVFAAYPLEGQKHGQPFSYDPASGTLEIKGVKVKLVGQREVAIECGDASFVVTEDGAVQARGERILSAAIETNRIEGGAIEFN
jgi:hypothetical protein